MTTENELSALAGTLRGADETTLGPTDAALCATALEFYAKARRRRRNRIIMSFVGAVATLGSAPLLYASADINKDGKLTTHDAHLIVSRTLNEGTKTRRFVFGDRMVVMDYFLPKGQTHYEVVSYQVERRLGE